MAAERRTWAPPAQFWKWSFNGAATGWPRNVAHDADVARLAAPSMRPRPDGRGTYGTPYYSDALDNLQWGRDRMAAERRPARRPSRPTNSFNGAATGWPRNGGGGGDGAAVNPLQWGRDRMAAERLSRLTTCHASTSFNGAATGWPRNARCRRSCRRHDPGFNGAATGWPRNGHRLVECGAEAHASMGPRPDGRGTVHDPEGRQGRKAASMGPRPDGRGTPCACHTFGARARFNGAATGWPRNGRVRRKVVQGQEASMGPRPDGRGTRRYGSNARL